MLASLAAQTSVVIPALDDEAAIGPLSPLRIFIPVAAGAFGIGAAYAAWTIATQSHVTDSSVLLILLSVVIFLVGLVSQQISSLRFEGRKS